MEAALLITSLALLVGMVAQLARLPRRRRTAAQRITARASLGGPTRGSRFAGLRRVTTVD
jgi:hypothetical protein